MPEGDATRELERRAGRGVRPVRRVQSARSVRRGRPVTLVLPARRGHEGRAEPPDLQARWVPQGPLGPAGQDGTDGQPRSPRAVLVQDPARTGLKVQTGADGPQGPTGPAWCPGDLRDRALDRRGLRDRLGLRGRSGSAGPTGPPGPSDSLVTAAVSATTPLGASTGNGRYRDCGPARLARRSWAVASPLSASVANQLNRAAPRRTIRAQRTLGTGTLVIASALVGSGARHDQRVRGVHRVTEMHAQTVMESRNLPRRGGRC